MKTKKDIEKLAAQILKESNIDSIPVPIHELAYNRGLGIRPYELGDAVSGVLVIKDGTGFIGYNPNESIVRQRFTMAHELGHYVLHHNEQDLFIDKDFKVEFRDQNSSTGTYAHEIEANAFAAAILMPEHILVNEIRNHKFELSDDESLEQLAKLFNVSVSAMSFRLSNLGYEFGMS